MSLILIENGRLTDPRGNGCLDASVLIKDGVISRVLSAEDKPQINDGTRASEVQRIDAKGKLVFPGLIDAHVHFRDPGFTEKEDISSGAKAAAHGGFTTVIMMGNTRPPLDTPEILMSALEKGKHTGINIFACGNVTVGMNGRELTDFEALKRAGAVLMSDDGLPILDASVMEKACKKAAECGLVLSLHEEDPAFIGQAGINSGAVAGSMGINGASREAEISMVDRDIRIAADTGAEITIQHISAAESVEAIRKAKAAGIKVHAEGTPHHFSLTEEAVRQWGANARMNPPLRTEADRIAIIEGLKDETIDMIATDHAPHTKEEKDRGLAKAPSGIIGLETALSLTWKSLVIPGHLTPAEAIRRLTRAYEVYGLKGGTLLEGEPADVVIFDPEDSWTVSRESILSKSLNTPFLGETLPGTVRAVICKGKVIYSE
ncbi:MAG: dihydroorotase [Lachnospiraceae bacterium]|nr:dihydroorotase [Lachnospiraceae bacterium]